MYGKPDYHASATVISESHGVMKMMAITNEAGSDDGRPRTLGPSWEYGGSLSAIRKNLICLSVEISQDMFKYVRICLHQFQISWVSWVSQIS